MKVKPQLPKKVCDAVGCFLDQAWDEEKDWSQNDYPSDHVFLEILVVWDYFVDTPYEFRYEDSKQYLPSTDSASRLGLLR